MWNGESCCHCVCVIQVDPWGLFPGWLSHWALPCLRGLVSSFSSHLLPTCSWSIVPAAFSLPRHSFTLQLCLLDFSLTKFSAAHLFMGRLSLQALPLFPHQSARSHRSRSGVPGSAHRWHPSALQRWVIRGIMVDCLFPLHSHHSTYLETEVTSLFYIIYTANKSCSPVQFT